jgi:excisionase family DNA binding protein
MSETKGSKAKGRGKATAIAGLLTVPEVAARVGVRPTAIYNWIDAGRLPYVRIAGRFIRVKESDAAALIVEVPASDPFVAGP